MFVSDYGTREVLAVHARAFAGSAALDDPRLCEWLQAGADKDVVSEVEFTAPSP